MNTGLHPIADGTPVKIDQGFSVYSTGIILSSELRRTNTGYRRYYKVKLTGGRDSFKRLAKVGLVVKVNSTNVTINKYMMEQSCQITPAVGD